MMGGIHVWTLHQRIMSSNFNSEGCALHLLPQFAFILATYVFIIVCREALQEDEEGSLQASVDDIVHRAKRRRLLDRPINIRLGMVCIVKDPCSYL